MRNYLFKSERLGFRNWLPEDTSKLALMNASKEVMEFFPSTKSLAETRIFIDRMTIQLAAKGYCYFAVDTLEDEQFIGFIGLSEQTFTADFTPCIDIGWRLDKVAWGKGYATEGARRCLKFAFEVLKLGELYSMAPSININSLKVMEKIGMTKIKTFEHPMLLDILRLKECLLYKILR
jgi:RimJ/RimL family protein N-acetyltransferase